MTLRALFRDLARAIREMDGTTGPIPARSFPERVRAIPTGADQVTLEALRITSPPAKTEYRYSRFGAEAFDPSGLALEAELSVFSRRVSLPVELSQAVLSPDGPLNPETEQVVLTLRLGRQEVSACQPVTMLRQLPTWAFLERTALTWQALEAEFSSWQALEQL